MEIFLDIIICVMQKETLAMAADARIKIFKKKQV